MKRNISKNAIKAMAIAMAVTLGSTTALSNTYGLQEVKAEEIDVETYAEASITITNPNTLVSNVTTSSYIVTANGLLFKVSDAGTTTTGTQDDGTVEFIGVANNNFNGTATDGNNTPFLGSIEDNRVKITSKDGTTDVFKFKLKSIGKLSEYTLSDSSTPAETETKSISYSHLKTVLEKIEKAISPDIKANAFNNIKIDGNTSDILDLSAFTIADANALQNATFNCSLKLGATNSLDSKDYLLKGSTINGDLDISGISNIGKALSGTDKTSNNEGVKITGNLKLGSGTVTFGANSLDYVTLKTLNLSNATLTGAVSNGAEIDNLILPANFTGGSNAFTNLNIIETLDLRAVTGTILADTFVYPNGQSFSDNIAIKEVILPETGNININAFKGADIYKVDYRISDTQEISLGTTNNNRNEINYLNWLTVSSTKLSDNAFKNARLPNPLELPNVEEIGSNVFTGVVSNADYPLNVHLPKYDDSWLNPSALKIKKDSFGSASDRAYFRIILPEGKDGSKLQAYLLNRNAAVGQVTEEVLFKVSDNKYYSYKFAITKQPLQQEHINENGKATLINFEVKKYNDNEKEKVESSQANSNIIGNGVVTLNGKNYDITVMGDGKNSLGNIPYDALVGNSRVNTRMATADFNLTTNVEEIAPKAFKDNKEFSLTEQLAFDKVSKVGADAFRNSSIRTLYLPVVKTIESKAFAGSALQSVRLGNDLAYNTQTKFRNNIFDGCDRLTDVYTNKASKFDIETAIKNSQSNNVSLSIKDKDGFKEYKVSSASKGSSSSSSSNSSGGSYGGGYVSNNGSSVGVATPEGVVITGSTDSSSTNGTVTPSFESKPLTKDVINLPAFTGEAKVFGDVSSSHWAKTYIDKLSQAGILNGSNGNFNPNGQTKRADVTIMLVKLLGLQPEANGRFSDVNPNSYYAPYVGTASTYGIVNGSNGMFNPEAVISRQDTMVMISQILEALNINTNTDKTALNAFSDASQISSYAVDKVANLVNSGIISGNKGKLNPKAPVTRAEMATIMSKLYDVIKG